MELIRSSYYHKSDVSKIASNGFSCGGLMAQGTAANPRLTTWMINSSGGLSADQNLGERRLRMREGRVAEAGMRSGARSAL